MYRISLNFDNISISEKELKKRLGGLSPEKLNGERLAFIISDVKKNTSCLCTLRKTEVLHKEEGVDLGFGYIKSRNLKKNLEGIKEAYIICASLGPGADMLLRKAEIKSVLDQYIYDAVLSSYIESVCDYVQENIKEKIRARFAPGYGDFDISWQEKLLSYAGGNEIGISLNESNLMIPTKSITAVMGIIK